MEEIKRFYRTRNERVIFGICGGLAEYFNLDPVLVRLLFVGLAFASFGTAVLIYIVIFFVVPEEPFEKQIRQEKNKE